jgi:hypothetical protein
MLVIDRPPHHLSWPITKAAEEVDDSIDCTTTPVTLLARTHRVSQGSVLCIQADTLEIESLATAWARRWDLRIAVPCTDVDITLISVDAMKPIDEMADS